MNEYKKIQKISFKERLKTLKLAYNWTYKAAPKLTITLLITSFFSGLFVIVSPYVYKVLIDYLTGLDLTTTTSVSMSIIVLIIIYVLIIFLSAFLSELNFLLKTTTNVRIEKYASSEIMNKASELDIEHFEDAEFYDNLYKANQSIPRIPDLYRFSTNTFKYLVSVIAIIITLIIFEWRIALLVVAGSIPNLFVGLKFADINFSLFNSNSPKKRKAWYFLNLLNTDKKAIKEIKLFSLKHVFLKKWDTLLNGIIERQDRAVKKQIKFYFIAKMFNNIFILFAILFSIDLFIKGEITIGSIIFALALIFQFSDKLGNFFEVIGYLNESLLQTNSLVTVFNYKSKINTAESKLNFPKKLTKNIILKNVYFKYPKAEEYVLKNINLEIIPGENIAIVGENGSGKTTFIKLLTRLYDVTKGEILIEDKNIKEYNISDIHKNIGVIFQDFVQYETTVKENIHFGDVDKSSKDIEASAIKSGAHNFIKDFDKKYLENLGRTIEKNGKELSGGQWQKIALARAFFKNSKILILDEPTAAIDAKAEYDLFKRFRDLTKNKTTILISHRFSTVKMADRIIVMDKGKIVEDGSHKELMEKKGIYHNLFTLQAKGYEM